MNTPKFLKKHALLPSTALVIGLISTDVQAASCSFTNVVGVNFGTYDVFDPVARDSTGSVTVTCTGLGGADLISIEIGAGYASSPADRYMLNGTVALDYNLYLDASRMTIWGNGSSGTSILGPLSIANDTPTTWTVYGRLPPLQNVSAGNYADSVVVTVLF